MDDEQLESLLARVRAAGAQNRAPVLFYELPDGRRAERFVDEYGDVRYRPYSDEPLPSYRLPERVNDPPLPAGPSVRVYDADIGLDDAIGARPIRRQGVAPRAVTGDGAVLRMAPPRTWGERNSDAFRFGMDRVTSTESPIGWLGEFFRGPTIADRLGWTGEEGVQRFARERIRRENRDLMREEEYYLGVTDGPGVSISNWSADILGGLGAYAFDPVSWLSPGRSVLARMGWAGGINAGQNALGQALELAEGTRRDWASVRTAAELQGLTRELGRDAAIQALYFDDEVPADFFEDGPGRFSWEETALAGALGFGFQGGLEALGFTTTAFLRAAGRARIRSLGDPELDRMARLPDGTIDPRALPVEAHFASADPWLREFAPVVERAARSIHPEVRLDAYAEIAVRLSDALETGHNPMQLAATIRLMRDRGEVPDLRVFSAIESIARGVASGRFAENKLARLGDTLTRLTNRFDPVARRDGRTLTRLVETRDPMIARLRQRKQAFTRALTDVVAPPPGARPPRDMSVEAPGPPRRLISDDERAEIDALARHVAQLRKAVRGAERGQTLTQFVRSEGGISDDRGDIAAFAGHWRGFLALVSDSGKPIDQMIERAVEAGYFPAHVSMESLPDQRAFIDALEGDARGIAPLYGKQGGEAAELEAEAGRFENWLERHGVDLTTRDEDTLKRQIADKIYDAEYAEPAGMDANAAPLPDADPASAPPAWGMRYGAGQGGGGAQLAPQVRLARYRTPIARQTFIRRQLRGMKRKGVTTYVRDVLDTAYTAFIEGQHPIVVQQKRMIREIERLAGARLDLRPSENAAMLARLSRDSYSPGHLDLMDGVRPYRKPGVKSSPSFREAVETATGGKEWTPERVGQFEDYLIARRAVKAWDRYARGELPRPPHAMTKMELADALRTLETDNPQFSDAADKLYQFLNAHWQKKRDAGLITDEQFQAGKLNNEDYVPFQRDMDDPDPQGGGMGDRRNKRRAFQRFRGSDRRIVSPLTSIMQDVYDTADRIARNETYRAFVDMAARAGDMGESIAVKIDRPLTRTEIDVADEVRRAAKAMGMTRQDAEALAGSIDALLNGETARVIYRPGEIVEGARKIIYVWRDGKREAWELTDPDYADDLFKAMTGLTQEARDLFLDIVAVPTQFTRTAITAHPAFQTANLIRDSLSAWMLTDVGFKPGESLFGAAQVLRQGDLAKLYNAVGTMGGGMVRSALPRTRIQRDLPALRGKLLRVKNLQPHNAVGQLWRAFEQATELSENATRIRLFGRAYGKAKRQGASDYDAALWAAYESRDYIDFQRSGAKMLNARRVMLFLNAMIQGSERTFRSMANEGDLRTLMRPLANMMQGKTRWADMTPAERYTVTRAWKLWAKMGLVGLFGLMLTALHADDEDYQYGFSDYIKNNYWLIRAGEYWITIPKPFDLAIVSNIMERSYEATAGNDPTAWGRLVWGLGDTYAPPTEVMALTVPIQLMNNRTNTGAPIVPEGLEDLDPHLQYTAMTSQVMIDFAKAVHDTTGLEVSPAQLDHVVSGYFQNFFRDPARVHTTAQGDRPAMNLTDYPVISRFLREPGRGGTPARVAFNDQVMRRSGDLQRAAATLREFLERGDSQAAARFLEERSPYERDYAVMAMEPARTARLHPMRRARDVAIEISRVRRELSGARPNASEQFFLPDLTPRQRRIALSALDDVAAAEMQAALVMAGAPGFEGRDMMDVDGRYERLRTVAPGVYALLRARLLTGRERAYDFDTVRRLWPEVRGRVTRDLFAANLGDLASEASGDYASAALIEDELVRLGGRRVTERERERQQDDLEERLSEPVE